MHLPRPTRRSFLKTTLAAGVAPFFLPSHIWAAETAPNSRLGVGYIGIGKQMRGHIGGFTGKGEVQSIAVCDVDTNRRNDGKKQVDEAYTKKNATDYKGCATHEDFRELLARKDIDAVVIATPDHWHTIIALEAAKAGKDIYCEKPLTDTIHEAKALVAGVREHKRVFQTGSQQRSTREFRIACELVRNGVIGKVSKVTAGFGGPGKWCDLPEQPVEEGLNWDLWLGPAPLRPYNEILSPRGVHTHFPMWRMYREYGGGMVTDWGAHHLDITQWGLGADESGPVEVIPPSDWETAQFGAKLIYKDGVEVTHIAENGVTFFGTDGEIYVNRGKFKMTLKGVEKAKSIAKEDQPSLNEQLDKVEKEFLAEAKVKLYASADHKQDFLDAIKKRSKPICDVEIGARSVMACHLTNFAYNYGQKFAWDPAKNDFARGGEAKWLTREYRGAWKVA